MRLLSRPLLIAALWLAGCAPRAGTPPTPPPDAPLEGQDYAQLDLLRAFPGGQKVYIEARMPDGDPAIFLVDTGAGVSAISQGLADRLSITGQDLGMTLHGLGGSAPWYQATLPFVDIGGVIVSDVEVAVAVPGMPEFAGWIPIDGILGNNVWGSFVLAIDYPADVLEVGLPGTIEIPAGAPRMAFDGAHITIPVVLHAGEADIDPVVRSIVLELDTGARGVLLSGPTGAGLESVSTEAEEPILGLGASDRVPVSAFYRKTRRVPLQAVELGGQRIEDPGPATWMNYTDATQDIGPVDMLGLAGHELLEDHRAVLDYPGGHFALTDSIHPARQNDGHQVLLDRELACCAKDASRGLVRAQYRLALEDYEGGLKDLDVYLKAEPDDPEARVLRARVQRIMGDVDGYLDAATALTPTALVEQDEIIAVVNSLALVGRVDEALTLAEAAIAEHPDDGGALLALADARYAAGDYGGARAALSKSAEAIENPDAHLKRRARVALAEGDPAAALSNLRRRLSLYPSDGDALWFYAMLVSAPERGGLGLSDAIATFQADRDRAMSRLHPEARPLDFLVAADRLTGAADPATIETLLTEGIGRDCDDIEEEPSRNNCMAWYQSMAGDAGDAALALIQGAVDAEPHRSDFLDTLAMVYLTRGELAEAADAALEAARITPDRFYHLWQVERITSLANASGSE
ncbi:MAG: tetratricopeptide repeat protein [Alphaproteobacteria bacterium]|nr:tetratricopeptide repeat protein [Alphaproteobacteria bacterium]